MKTLFNVVLAANGSPSEVKARINDQVQATAQAPEQAPIVAAVRDFVEKKLAGVSEDETLSVTANVAIVVSDPPAIVIQKREDEKAIQDREIRIRETTIADRDKQIAQLKADLEALKPKAETPAAG